MQHAQILSVYLLGKYATYEFSPISDESMYTDDDYVSWWCHSPIMDTALPTVPNQSKSHNLDVVSLSWLQGRRCKMLNQALKNLVTFLINSHIECHLCMNMVCRKSLIYCTASFLCELMLLHMGPNVLYQTGRPDYPWMNIQLWAY